MLIGTYKSLVGDKKRIAFPKKLKVELGEELIITKGYDGCLLVVNKNKWDILMQSIKDIPFVYSNIRDTKRFLIGSAVEVQLDSQGRFILPDNLSNFIFLKKTAVFLGLVDWVEIWDEEKWAEKEMQINKNSISISESVANIIKSVD